jgi:cell division protein FtsI (penicillin-binding protein 3)
MKRPLLPPAFRRANRPLGAGARASERRVPAADHPLLSVQLPAWRSKALLFLLFCSFSALVLRALYLQGGFNTQFLQKQGEARYARTLDVPGTRGKITDRNGVVLASSVPARAIWAIPDDVDATPQQLGELARLLQMAPVELKRKLAGADGDFVFLRRPVEQDVAERIAELKIPGIHQSRAFKRHYPEAATAAHLIGFANVEERGLEGVELAFESQLAARKGSRRVIKDRLGRVVEGEWQRMPAEGSDVALSIDNRIQYIAHTAVRNAVDAHRAKAGAAIVIDVRTGEVLALANWPSFDPNRRDSRDPDAQRNRVLTDMFEPGSTLKPFSIAAALDAGKVTPDSRIQTAPGRLTIGNRTIGDTHPHDLLSVAEIVAKSSNVGTAKIALEMPAQALWNTYAGVGFGQPPSIRDPEGRTIPFEGAVAGRLRPYRTWRPIEQATISYGYGVSVTLAQLARAYTVFARDGDLPPLTLTRRDGPVAGVPVLRPETARTMRSMLELAVSDEGTAPLARVPGYRVGGKTGTARKLRNEQYVNAYVASFAGFAPASDPRIAVAVLIDEPGAGRYYGGDVAAPVFSQIVAGAMRTLQIAPDGALTPPRRSVLAAREVP